MAGDPPVTLVSDFAQLLHDRWEIHHESVARRREEDVAACRILKADYLHWPVPDCIYRHHPQTGEPYYTSDPDLFGTIHHAENTLVNDLAQHLMSLPKYEHIFVPLSVGNHVDHQITRLAAERCFSTNLIYYEEYPYATAPSAVQAAIAKDGAVWQSKTVPIPESAMISKLEAIAAYDSQLSTFFLDHADLERQVRHYSQAVGGERKWWRHIS
jgi:LmbE family N-acetylglucosaminyl deacetylase